MQYTKSQFLMWTDVTINVNSINNPSEYIYNSFSIFYSLEKEFSRFLDSSELFLLNNSKEMKVSSRFIDIFNISKSLNDDTNHYFNPLVNLSNIGYSSDFWKGLFEKKWDTQNLDLNTILVIWDFISLNKEQNLDFWWFVKWYAVDMVSKYLVDNWFNDFIINAGWDIYIWWDNQYWKTPVVAIDSPFNPAYIFATLELSNQAISTSWTYKRNWKINDKWYHHIIDPITKENNYEIVSVSIIHEKCYIADAYATACIAMWIEKSIQFLSQKNIDWVIIWSDGKVYEIWNMSEYNLEII